MIPRVLHRIWLGGPMPELYQQYGRMWEELNPGWTFRLWSDDDFGWLENQDLFDNAAQFVPSDAVYQFKSDVARYEILRRFGGVYADCDVEPLQPFNALLDVEVFAGWEQEGIFVGNTVLGSVAGASFWDSMVRAVRDSTRQNPGKAATWVSGPRVLTRVRNEVRGITVYPQHYFFPYSYKDFASEPELKEYPNSYSAHHWGHQRELRNRPMRANATKNPSVSVAIMAHQKRAGWVPDLQAQLPTAKVVWDRFNDRHDTGARALASYESGATHHMVIQDDALLAADLYPAVLNVLKNVPVNNPVGLYVGRARPRTDEVRTLMTRAVEEKASFMVHKGPWWGVGIVLPTAHIRPLLDFYDGMPNVPNYDRRIARYFESKGLLCYYTVPSLVDHRIEGNPSLVPGRGADGRYAYSFIGPRSALDVDWSGPIVRGKT